MNNNYIISIFVLIVVVIVGLIVYRRAYKKGEKEGEGKLIRDLRATDENSTYTFLLRGIIWCINGFKKDEKKGVGIISRRLQAMEKNSRRANVYTFFRCVARECLEEGGNLYQLALNHRVRTYYFDIEIPSFIENGDKFVVHLKNGKYEFLKCNKVSVESEEQIFAEA
jgi:hypothetical protein